METQPYQVYRMQLSSKREVKLMVIHAFDQKKKKKKKKRERERKWTDSYKEPPRNRKFEQTNHKYEIENVIKIF